jgi:hypothetical protein
MKPGASAVVLTTDSTGEVTVEEAEMACLETSGCAGFSFPSYSGTWDGEGNVASKI